MEKSRTSKRMRKNYKPRMDAAEQAYLITADKIEIDIAENKGATM